MQQAWRNRTSAYDAVLVDDHGAARAVAAADPAGTGRIGLTIRLITVSTLFLGTIWFWPGDDGDHVSAIGERLDRSTTTAAPTTTASPISVTAITRPADDGAEAGLTTSSEPSAPASANLSEQRTPLQPLVATTPIRPQPPLDQTEPASTVDRTSMTGETTTAPTPITRPGSTIRTAATAESATGPATTATARPPTTRPPSTAGPTATTTTRPTTTTTKTRPTTTTTRPTTTTTTTRPTTTTTGPTTTTTTGPTTTATTRPTTTTTRPTTSATQPTTTAGGTCATNGDYERVLRDDFSGTSVAGHWRLFNGDGNGSFGERRRSAVTVENGRLIITAKMEGGTLVSGGMSHRYNQTYGKYRFRVRTDEDPSEAMSGVVLTWPHSQEHPRDGENNIYETLANAAGRNPFYSFIHEPFGTKSDQKRFVHYADGSQFQIMTMEWTPDHISITREGPGGAQYRETQTLNETGDDLIPDNPHKLHIQLDAWEHSISGAVRMEVDWVEIYKYCGQG